jgi:hypothetical protein
VDILKAIARKICSLEISAHAVPFISRPVMHVRPTDAAEVWSAPKTYSFIEAVTRFGHLVKQFDLALGIRDSTRRRSRWIFRHRAGAGRGRERMTAKDSNRQEVEGQGAVRVRDALGTKSRENNISDYKSKFLLSTSFYHSKPGGFRNVFDSKFE